MVPFCHSIWILVEPIFQTNRKTVRAGYFAADSRATAISCSISVCCFSNFSQLSMGDQWFHFATPFGFWSSRSFKRIEKRYVRAFLRPTIARRLYLAQYQFVAFQTRISYQSVTNGSILPLHLDFGRANLSNESKNGTCVLFAAYFRATRTFSTASYPNIFYDRCISYIYCEQCMETMDM
jgi:hypothetical protein